MNNLKTGITDIHQSITKLSEPKPESLNYRPYNYLEINSTYRDRTLWPNIGEFDVIIDQSGSKGFKHALDPVSYATPICYWNSSFQGYGSNAELSNLTVLQSDPNNLGDNITVVLNNYNFTAIFRTEPNFYVGCVLNSTPTDTGAVRRRIVNYNYVGTDGTITQSAIITLDNPLPDQFSFTGNCDIGIPSTSVVGTPLIFIPFSPSVDNYFINDYIRNTDTGEYRTIISFDSTTHLATLNSAPNLNWSSATYNFVIASQLPSVYSTFSATGNTTTFVTILNANNTYFALSNLVPTDPTVYIGSFLRLLWLQGVVPTNNLSNLSPSPPYGEIQRISNFISLSTTLINVSGSSFTLNTNAIPIDNYYVNCYLSSANTVATTYQIVSYTGATQSGTISKKFSSEKSGTPVWIQTVILQFPFTPAPATVSNTYENFVYEILPFNIDNFCPFSYNGSSISEPICYEVSLLDLILPNIVLTVGDGGTPAFYQYVYVELSPKSNRFSAPIWSNNPNANRMLFRVVVSDTDRPANSPYVRLISDGMTQTIKVKPYDNFHFSVKIPTGEVFNVDAVENYSPNIPNPLMQISAIFGFKRASNETHQNYIEAYSSYRDRTIWPSPAEFDLPFEMSGSHGKLSAHDPVSTSAKRLAWNISMTYTAAQGIVGGQMLVPFGSLNSYIYLTPTPSDPNNLGDSVEVLMNIQSTGFSTTYGGQVYKVPSQIWRPEPDFYSGCVLNVNNCRRRILSYTYIGFNSTTFVDTASAILESALPDSVMMSGTGVIGNTSFNTTIGPNPQIYIPFGNNTENYYVNSYITALPPNEAVPYVNSQYVQITYYDPLTHMATLANPTTYDWTLATQSTNLLIVDNPPMIHTSAIAGGGYYYQLLTPNIVTSTFTADNISPASNVSGFYNGDFILVRQQSPFYPSEDIPYTEYLAIQASTPWVLALSIYNTAYPYMQETRITNYIALDTTLINNVGTGNVFVFGTNASVVDNIYVNCYITTTRSVVSGTYGYQIISYVGATQSGTISTTFFNEAIGATASIRTIQLTTPFLKNIFKKASVDILQFSNDNFCPMSYNGTHIQEPICYEVDLINCVIPNSVLTVDIGGLPAFYPYFYVELTSVSTPTKNSLWSTNPNSHRALFRAVVSDTTRPSVSPYVRLRNDDTAQVIKFNPRDVFHFSIRLATGDLVSTNTVEYYSPQAPNPNAQISAIFSVRRF